MEGSKDSLQEKNFEMKLAKPKDVSKILDQTTVAIDGEKIQK